MKKINILLLGAGGNVSQGILQAILRSNLKCKVIGACVNEESAGIYFCDSSYISPYAQDKKFIPWLIKICNKEKIDIVLTGVEENIIEIAAHIDEFHNKTKSLFICSPYKKLQIGQDKLKTNIWLKENGCNYPQFAISNDTKNIKLLVKNVGYPMIAKPIKGKGSKGIFTINNKDDLTKATKLSNYIIQEHLGDDSSEYTVGCYRNKSGITLNPIIMHRELKYGTTVKAEVVNNKIIEKEAIKICDRFKPTGPLNIQLRMDKNNKPVCFELNIRFSGTTPMRAYFGFNDVEAMIKEYVLDQKIPDKFIIKKGSAFRYMNEIYLNDDVKKLLKRTGYIPDMKKYNISIDDLRKTQ